MSNYRSIRSKVLLPLFISLSVVFVIFQFSSNYLLYQEDKASRLKHVQVLSNATASNIQAAITFDDEDNAKEQLSSFYVDEEVLQVQLTLMDGSLFSEYKRDEGTLVIDPSFTTHIEKGYFYGSGYFHVFTSVMLNDEQIGLMHIISENRFLEKVLKRIINIGMFLIIMLIGLSFYLYDRLNNLIVKPVAHLKFAMSHFLENKVKLETLKVVENDELGDLVADFNTMVAKIESRDKKISLTLEHLAQEKIFAEDVIESVQHGLFLVDHKGIIQHCNGAAKALFNSVTIKKSSIYDFFEKSEHSLLMLAIEDNQHLQAQTLIARKGLKEEKILSISSTSQKEGETVLFSIDDISDTFHANYRQKLAERVFENSQDGILVIDSKGNITMSNSAIESLLNCLKTTIYGRKPEEVLNWENFSSHMPLILESVEKNGMWQGEIWESDCNNEKIPIFVKANKIEMEHQSGQANLVLMLTDMRDAKEVERLDHLAHHDSLTGLGNREKLYNLLESPEFTNQQGKFSIIYLDLDGFKLINDTYGHDAGDEVLKVVSNRLLSLTRENDYVFRLAGDEFIIVVNSNNVIAINKLVKRILDSVSQLISFNNQQLKVGISLGVHITRESEVLSTNSLLKKADQAMYQSKSLGKGRAEYSIPD